MIKVLHILPYEKYVDCVVDMWDKSVGQCEYVCVDQVEEQISSTFPKGISMVSDGQLIEKIIRGDYNVIVFSSLPTHYYHYVLHVPKEKKIIWQSVGYDIYNSCYPFKAVVTLPLFKPLTREFIRKSQEKSSKLQIRHLFSMIFKPVTNYKKCQHVRKLETDALNLQNTVLQRIDYISTVLDVEYKLLKLNPQIIAQHFAFKYIRPIEVSYNNQLINFERTKYILIGNSGDETNNHLDILRLISQRGIDNPLFVPLAYGGEKDYVDMLCEKLNDNSGNVILKRFTDRNTYLELLLQCRAAVFGHIRQQALGNISVMLMQGCKVFLYKDSVTYKYFKELGVCVFSIEDDLTQEAINTPLSAKQISHNSKCFEGEYEKTLAKFKNDVIQIKDEVEKSRNQ